MKEEVTKVANMRCKGRGWRGFDPRTTQRTVIITRGMWVGETRNSTGLSSEAELVDSNGHSDVVDRLAHLEDEVFLGTERSS